MEAYVEKGGKRLRLGYTTGSCAAAAAKAAAWMLLLGGEKRTISLITPKGFSLELEIFDIHRQDGQVQCAVKKDSGDDPDVTNGTLIYAAVRTMDTPGVDIDGGIGIGRVTKPGLDQPVGAAAINSVPRRMIVQAVEEIMALADYRGGLQVVISAPEGETLARKTFNPRLGIQGGISILGTTGIVEPMSEQALVDTIRVELRQKRQFTDVVLLTPGNYGAEFIRKTLKIAPDTPVQCSNFIGDSLDICRDLGFRGALLVGHLGKLVKIGGGMLNTHSKYGDCRMEILAAHAAMAGLPPAQVAALLQCVACDDALALAEKAGCGEAMMKTLVQRIGFHLQYRAGDSLEVGAAVFSQKYGLLGQTDNAWQLLKQIKEG